MNLGKKMLILLFISKDFRKSESSSCKSSISSGGRILSFRAFILMSCVTKKRKREKKRQHSIRTIGAELRKRGKISSVVLVATSQRKLPLIIFCARCVVRWCLLVFYRGKRLYTIMPATEELLKAIKVNKR